MLFLILIILLAIAFYFYFVKPMTYWREHGVKQGTPIPVFGEFWKAFFKLKSMPDMLIESYNAFPGSRYSGFYQFNQRILLIKDPDLIKQITVKDFEYFTNHRPFIDPESDPVFGRNLMALKGQEWRQMRATLSTSFTTSKIKVMFGLIKDVSQNLQSYLIEQDKDVYEVELKDFYTRFTSNVIASVAFGANIDSLRDQNNEFFLMGKEATDLSTIGKTLKFIGYIAVPFIYKIFSISLMGKGVSNYFKNLIYDSIKVREEKGIKRPDMINALLEARNGLAKHEKDEKDTGFAVVEESSDVKFQKSLNQITNDDIVSQGIIFIFAGYESIANLLCFATYELAVNTDIQDKLRAEITDTLEQCNDDITYDGISKMKYLDMVVTETLRKWPVIIGTDRVCTKRYVIEPKLADEVPVKIDVGNMVIFNTMGTHRDPQYYPEPDKFDPERFSDENKRNIKPYTFFPFGIGPRSCIATRLALIETKCLLIYILSRFEIVPTARTQIPLKFCKKTMTMAAEKGFWLGFKRI